jgi:membrane protein implicated in regulation of membrane protease activity
MKSTNINLIEKLWQELKLEAEQSSLRQLTSLAIVVSDIKPFKRGRIQYQATYWFGRCEDNVTLVVGMPVEVVRREGNTWVVRSILH